MNSFSHFQFAKKHHMKKYIVLGLLVFLPLALLAQEKPIKLVMDVSSPDPNTHKAVALHLGLLSKNYPDSQFEVVLYGKSYDMAIKEKSSVATELEKLVRNDRVSIKICRIAMDHFKVTDAMLIPGIEPVPDAFMEIALKQGEGWAYIKEAHH